MNDRTLLAACCCGAVVGGAVLLLIVAIRGTEPREETPSVFRRGQRREPEEPDPVRRRDRRRSDRPGRDPLAGPGGGPRPAGGDADRFFGGTGEERRAIERLEALATWTEALRDTIAGAVGLEQAIPATAVNAAPAIQPGLNLLVDRLRIREPLPDGIDAVRRRPDDPSADLIVAALILNARLRGPGLREVLSALADSAREELDVRRRVAAERRSTRRSVQIVVAITLVVAAGLVLFNPTYMQPYTSFIGQVVLAVVIALYALGLIWLRRLARIEVPERFLIRSDNAQRGNRSGDQRMEVVGG